MLKKILKGDTAKTEVSLQIELDKQIWEVEETVTGNVHFKRSAPIKVGAVKLRIVGYEVVQVTDSYDVPESKRTKNKLVFDTHPLMLFGGKKATKLDAGETYV